MNRLSFIKRFFVAITTLIAGVFSLGAAKSSKSTDTELPWDIICSSPLSKPAELPRDLDYREFETMMGLWDREKPPCEDLKFSSFTLEGFPKQILQKYHLNFLLVLAKSNEGKYGVDFNEELERLNKLYPNPYLDAPFVVDKPIRTFRSLTAAEKRGFRDW